MTSKNDPTTPRQLTDRVRPLLARLAPLLLSLLVAACSNGGKSPGY